MEPSTQSPTFLNLPPAIRMIIYEQYFESIVENFHRQLERLESIERQQLLSGEPRSSITLPASQHQTNILGVCRIICQESLPCFLGIMAPVLEQFAAETPAKLKSFAAFITPHELPPPDKVGVKCLRNVQRHLRALSHYLGKHSRPVYEKRNLQNIWPELREDVDLVSRWVKESEGRLTCHIYWVTGSHGEIDVLQERGATWEYLMLIGSLASLLVTWQAMGT